MNYLFKVLVVVALVCVLSIFVPLAGASQLTLVPEGSILVNDSTDDWLNESYVTTDSEFILEITNKNHPADELHLLVASNIVDDGNFTIYIDGFEIDIPNQILGLTHYNPEYNSIGGNGVYPTYHQDVNLNTNISADETVDVPVKIVLNATRTANPKVHFDAAGLNDAGVLVIKSANSHDATYYAIPEFSTIALPMLSILGLMFIMSRKRK
ncbi:MAG: PEF-CTERM sorting domain-containing protein [Methanosarcinaceae archaeon]|nr:PEF-CTERM sorting domain-containing protein [Methanosarcinaceae archaeon]